MQSFSHWLITESIATLIDYKPLTNLEKRWHIPHEVAVYIYQIVSSRPDKEQVPYAMYLFGFYITKTNARDEDYQMAMDNYTFYRRNKGLFHDDFIQRSTFDIGQLNGGIQEIKDNNISNTRMKKQGKMLDNVDMSRVKEEKFGEYTFYTIPKATNPKEQMENKGLYCKLGKNTHWCTASPDGNYYTSYVYKLDITVIYKDGNQDYIKDVLETINLDINYLLKIPVFKKYFNLH